MHPKIKALVMRMGWLGVSTVQLLYIHEAAAAAPGNVASVSPTLRDQQPVSPARTDSPAQDEPTARPESPPAAPVARVLETRPRVEAANGRQPNGGLIASGAVLLGTVWQTTTAVTFSDLGALQAWPSLFPLIGPLAQLGVNETGVLTQLGQAPMEMQEKIPLHLPKGLMTGLLVSSTVLQSAGLAMIIAGATKRKNVGSEQLALRAIPGLEVSTSQVMMTLAGGF